MTALGDTKLGAWLRKEKPEYFYKAEELRDTVTGWLGYIVQTFPHYTRHTVDHSDNIVRQMSHLLFRDKSKKPVIALSPIEAYVLIAAAYLHDAGMVVPDREKQEILASEEWKRWVAGERWEKVAAIRNAGQPADPAVRDFLADVYIRHLIAEFVRRVHHKRAARVITDHADTFTHFSLGEPRVARTIAAVCIGHGLSHNELDDAGRYPEHTQLAGDSANVRWMAILLRLGDLLDMRADRACPLLLNAAAPLPPESIVHWTQYEKLTQLSVTPKRIEIGAECDTRDEYQVLRDWTQWIEDEVKNAALVMRHAERHGEWKVPETKITIGRSESARFLIDDWKFELDRDAVFERLIYDVYAEPITFIRELIQNALDATRVQMYLDLDADGIPRPEYPTQIDESRRERYPVEIAFETRTVNGEERQVFSITDHGVGMDRGIISRYLLQIGRSYYTSDEFRQDFRFVPTSRFGVGFLSVFAVADQVTIDTYKPTSPAHDGPVRLMLRGVRNYVLPQVGNHDQRGTRIEIMLREPIGLSDAMVAIQWWCRRVEVPIRVVTSEGTTVIRSETLADFESHVPDLDTPRTEWHVRAHPFHEGGVQGEIYIESCSCEGMEELGQNRANYNATHPLHPLPTIPSHLTCLHGITDLEYEQESYWSYRIDIRRPSTTTLSRVTRPEHSVDSLLPEVRRALAVVIRAHLGQHLSALGSHAWRDHQFLAARFPAVLEDLWLELPMIPATTLAGKRLLTLAEIAMEPGIVTDLTVRMAPEADVAGFEAVPMIATSEEQVRLWCLDRRQPVAVQFDGTNGKVKWGPADGRRADFTFRYGHAFSVVLLPIAHDRVAVVAPKEYHLIVNRDHALAEWVRAAQRAVDRGQLTEGAVGQLMGHIRAAADKQYSPYKLEAWRGPAVPVELQPPPLVPLAPSVLGSADPDGPPPTPAG